MGVVEPIRKQESNTNNVVSFKAKKKQLKGEEVKLKKDGTPKQTPNNSKYGDPHEVYPIKKKEEIEAIINYFINKTKIADTEYNKKIAGRNLLMFVLGINVALRAGDLLQLKWKDVFDESGEFKDFRRLKEEKTKKFKNLYYNDGAKNAINKYIEEFNIKIEPDSYIFKSREKGSIDVRTACKILKEAANECGLIYNVGSHTMRKTFGYWFIKNNQNDMRALAKLQELLNHSSQKTTIRYIGLADEETKEYYDSNVLGMY
jgi:integrase